MNKLKGIAKGACVSLLVLLAAACNESKSSGKKDSDGNDNDSIKKPNIPSHYVESDNGMRVLFDGITGKVYVVPNGSVDSKEISINEGVYQSCNPSRDITVTGESASLKSRVKKKGVYSNIYSTVEDVCANEIQGDNAIANRLDEMVNEGDVPAAWDNLTTTLSDNSVVNLDGVYMDNDFNLNVILYHGEDQSQEAIDELEDKLETDGYLVTVYSPRKLSTLQTDLNAVGPAMMIAPAMVFIDDECEDLDAPLAPNSEEVYEHGFLMGTRHYDKDGKVGKVEVNHVKLGDGIYKMKVEDNNLKLNLVHKEQEEF